MNSLSIDHSLCFFFFVRYPCWMTARLLLECDANVNSLNNDGNTPLHILLQSSTMSNVMKMIDLLCDAGAGGVRGRWRGRRPSDSSRPARNAPGRCRGSRGRLRRA